MSLFFLVGCNSNQSGTEDETVDIMLPINLDCYAGLAVSIEANENPEFIDIVFDSTESCSGPQLGKSIKKIVVNSLDQVVWYESRGRHSCHSGQRVEIENLTTFYFPDSNEPIRMQSYQKYSYEVEVEVGCDHRYPESNSLFKDLYLYNEHDESASNMMNAWGTDDLRGWFEVSNIPYHSSWEEHQHFVTHTRESIQAIAGLYL